ncbi:MAG: amidase [Pseudomonadota bacterium]|nr:amidase [Pseudomonadota bacterium]
MEKDYGAFMPGERLRIDGSRTGPLKGKTFAAKDVFDIAGHPTSNGQPTWPQTHPLPAAHASAVDLLLSAGATLDGKTVCDEMCYSLAGSNPHYGAPLNPAAPDRAIGGSSSGSASAVAGELVDFALGTDCGGSVRCPASFSGIYGVRPTHGRVNASGVVPLAGSFDVVGWLARQARLLQTVGDILLQGDAVDISPTKAIIAEDMFARLPNRDRSVTEIATSQLVEHLGLETIRLNIALEGLDQWVTAFHHLQALEIWGNHGRWVTENNPSFGPGVRERFAYAATLPDNYREKYQPVRDSARGRVESLLADRETIVIMPTAPVSLGREASETEVEDFRASTMGITCPAGLSGCPQVSVPLSNAQGPIGISFLGPRKSDESLLELVTIMSAKGSFNL